MTTLVLDAVGGDHAPASALDGAMMAVERGYLAAEQLVLTGPQDQLEEAMRVRGAAVDTFRIVDAPDRLRSDDTPVEALRRKPRNSIAVGLGLVERGEANGFISAGSTGTVVASATVQLRCLEGIRRPGIAALIQGSKGPFMVVDVGANPQPKAMHLVQYALMGSAYYHDTFGVGEPRVGLLNIGSEDAKGNPLVKEARQLMRSLPINFVGNVEGVDVFNGACEVVVTDGFTGNVLLKVSEGLAEHMVSTFNREMDHAGIAEGLTQKVIGQVLRKVDYTEYGGALLLGVEGIVTICHGRSHGPAIANALRFAARAADANVNENIVTAVRATAQNS